METPCTSRQAGFAQAVNGHVLIYVHKEDELADIERGLSGGPLRAGGRQAPLLAAVKTKGRERLTTVRVRQGVFALDPSATSGAAADVTIERSATCSNTTRRRFSRTIGLSSQLNDRVNSGRR